MKAVPLTVCQPILSPIRADFSFSRIEHELVTFFEFCQNSRTKGHSLLLHKTRTDEFAIAFLSARCYASAAYAMALCSSVTSRNSIEMAELIDLFFFGTDATRGLSYIVLYRRLESPHSGPFPWGLIICVPNTQTDTQVDHATVCMHFRLIIIYTCLKKQCT